MNSFTSYFLLFILIVAVGFAGLIYFLMNYRRKFQSANLQMSPDDIWKFVAERAAKLGLPRDNLIYGVYVDVDSTTMSLIVKDGKGHIVGRAEKTLGEQQARIFAGDELYLIEYQLLKWNRTIELRSSEEDGVLAEVTELTFPIGKLLYKLAKGSSLVSERNYWNWQYQDNFRSEGRVIGTVQSIPPNVAGRIGILPPDLPLSIRIFILAHPLF